MVLAGHNVQDLIESNVYQGLEAKLKLSQWKEYERNQKERTVRTSQP